SRAQCSGHRRALHSFPTRRSSDLGMSPTRLIGSPICATALKVPSTLAAPHMSYFISSISAAGLSEMPPVSKVMPLPTSTMGFARSEEHTSELQSRENLVCRLLLEK